MSAPRNRPILVTGAHRSGTTFVGRMIAAHPRIVYISEPFNPSTGPTGSPVRYWFHAVTPPEEQRFRAFLRAPLTFHHSWLADLRANPRPRRLVGATMRKLASWGRLAVGCRPLLKDPIALLSAPWLAEACGAQVLVLIRHPGGFVSSLKRLDWHFPFADLLAQEEMLHSRLAPFVAEIREQAATPHSVVEQGILLWRLLHHVILQYRAAHPDWLFVRHEDLSRRPLQTFEQVFGWLGLTLSPEVRQVIEAHSGADNPGEAPGNAVHHLRRDSRANIWNWRHRLTPEEVARIRHGTHDVARHFYTDADWVAFGDAKASA
jgi:hypothetical protein